MPPPPKFQIKSRKWNIASAIGVVVLFVVGFGGLLAIQSSDHSSGLALALVVGLGILTFLLFAGPGFVYTLRKRVAFLKKRLPGGTMAWIRAHLYLPILAIAAAFVHATSAPFRDGLTSGKATLVVGVLVSIGGVFRHHMLGLQKEVLNANVAITKVAAAQPRAFRSLVTDLTENRRPLADIEADAAALDGPQQERWKEVRSLFDRIDHHFPRAGGQARHMRSYKVWRALHPPLTILLFGLLALHVWDVLGAQKKFFGSQKAAFASSSSCGSCHSEVAADWALSSMAHAQDSTIMKAQLPVTIGENVKLAQRLGGGTATDLNVLGKSCINCHAPVGARFVKNATALLPFDQSGSDGNGGKGVAVTGGNAAAVHDGIGCITCHTQAAPPGEKAGFGTLNIDKGGAADYGTQYGPLFEDPKPLPVRVHASDTGANGFWTDPIATSQLCGSCHIVKADLAGGGVLALQTTFLEWNDYITALGAAPGGTAPPGGRRPLGCVECHMPTKPNGKATQPVVDHGPGVNPVPDREFRSHTFVGVDYDLDPSQLSARDRAVVLQERQELLGSAVTLEVANQPPERGSQVANVVVRNNLLGHDFPTGFAFARQFWLEVSAKTTSGKDVCLAPAGSVRSPCASGVVKGAADDLRQCDPLDVARVDGLDPKKVGNGNIKFAAAFPATDCDPYLTNFQKILTDGDPDKDGVFNEVPFQSFLADIVKVRTRVSDQQAMAPLASLKPGDDPNADPSSKTFPYRFDTSALAPGESVVVTAKLRFRHLPPDFVRALEAKQKDVVMPADARIDAASLLKNMVVTDMVEAKTGAGRVLACKGPQNEKGASILDCAKPTKSNNATIRLRRSEPGDRARWLPAMLVAVAVGAVAGVRRRRRRLVRA
jgi:hypothetical protein